MTVIKIKRSSATGTPTNLGQGELAYSYLSGTQSNGGDRLYVGTGTETNGDAANIEVIGGKYFTQKLDHTPGVRTANSALIVDGNGKLDIVDVDNVRIDGNTISTTDTNGNLVLSPNGTGVISASGKRIINAAEPVSNTDVVTLGYLETTFSSTLAISSDSGSDTIVLNSDTLTVTGLDGITTNISGNQLTIDLDNTTVTPSTYGSATQIPTFTVDSQGRITSAGTNAVATTLDFSGDSGANTVNLLSDTMAFVGGTGVSTVASDNQVLFSIGQDVGTSSNVTFNGGTFQNNVTVEGDLIVNGNTTYMNVNTIEVEDALIHLASNNSSDSIDIGFIGKYNDGVDKTTGIFRDSTDGEFYVFDSYEDIDITDNIINKSSNTFNKGIFNAGIFRGSLNGNADTATKLQTGRLITLSGDVSGSVTFDGSQNVIIATTIQPDSIQLGTDTVGDYAATVSAGPSSGISVTGSGEGAAVVVSGINANNTVKGVSSYDANNFSVSSGHVSVTEIDGGTY